MASRPGPLRIIAQRKPLLGWLGIGLAVRLLLMPFTVSADLLAVYWRSHQIAYDGQLFGDYLVNMGAHYLHALSLRVFSFLLPPPDQVWTDPWWWADSSALAPQVQRSFSAGPDAYQTLFALKLPYLLADLGAGLVLLALVRAAAPQALRRAWAFWMLSPIGLYATYAFGRYEAFAVLLVLGALLACEREHPWVGALLLGLAITVRGYPLLLVPVFGLIVMRRPLARAAWAGLALAPFGATMLINQALADSVGELARLRDFSTGNTFLAYTLPGDGGSPVYVFGLFALILYGTLIGRAYRWWARDPARAVDGRDDSADPAGRDVSAAPAGRDVSAAPPGRAPVPLDELWIWLLVFHAGMFAFATFSAHYFMWFTPFVALALARRPRWRGVLPLHLLQVGAVIALADLLGGPGTVLGLFEPLDPGLATAAPNLREALLTSPALTLQVAGALRTAFVALTLLLAAPAVLELARGTGPAGAAGPEPGHAQGDRAGQRQNPEHAEPRLVQQPTAG